MGLTRMKKSDCYLRGRHFFWITDQKSWQGLSQKPLAHLTNPWLVGIYEKMMPYTFDTVWTQGSKMQVPDCLSRLPIGSHRKDGKGEEVIEEASKLKMYAITEKKGARCCAGHSVCEGPSRMKGTRR